MRISNKPIGFIDRTDNDKVIPFPAGMNQYGPKYFIIVEFDIVYSQVIETGEKKAVDGLSTKDVENYINNKDWGFLA